MLVLNIDTMARTKEFVLHKLQGRSLFIFIFIYFFYTTDFTQRRKRGDHTCSTAGRVQCKGPERGRRPNASLMDGGKQRGGKLNLAKVKVGGEQRPCGDCSRIVNYFDKVE